MAVPTLTADEILAATEKVGEVYKFVKVDGSYRFIKLQIYGPVHANMVDKDEKAEAAGTIMLRPCSWQISDRYSSTLGIGCSGKEEDELKALFSGRTSHDEMVMRQYEEEQRRQGE